MLYSSHKVTILCVFQSTQHINLSLFSFRLCGTIENHKLIQFVTYTKSNWATTLLSDWQKHLSWSVLSFQNTFWEISTLCFYFLPIKRREGEALLRLKYRIGCCLTQRKLVGVKLSFLSMSSLGRNISSSLMRHLKVMLP